MNVQTGAWVKAIHFIRITIVDERFWEIVIILNIVPTNYMNLKVITDLLIIVILNPSMIKNNCAPKENKKKNCSTFFSSRFQNRRLCVVLPNWRTALCLILSLFCLNKELFKFLTKLFTLFFCISKEMTLCVWKVLIYFCTLHKISFPTSTWGILSGFCHPRKKVMAIMYTAKKPPLAISILWNIFNNGRIVNCFDYFSYNISW